MGKGTRKGLSMSKFQKAAVLEDCIKLDIKMQIYVMTEHEGEYRQLQEEDSAFSALGRREQKQLKKKKKLKNL